MTNQFELPESLWNDVKKAKHIVFSDFDGTITLQDSNDYLTDNLGMGYQKRKSLNDLILVEKLSFRDGFQQMLDSVHEPWDECIEFLKKNIKLDTGFKDFYKWALANEILVIIVSSGMKPIIYNLLKELLNDEEDPQFFDKHSIEIISNDVKILDAKTGKWDIVYRDPTPFGHDKSIEIKKIIKYKKEHLSESSGKCHFFYCGDGVSDLSAARESELLFAKYGKDLIKYCESEKISYSTFKSFADIHNKINDILVEGKTIESFNELKNR